MPIIVFLRGPSASLVSVLQAPVSCMVCSTQPRRPFYPLHLSVWQIERSLPQRHDHHYTIWYIRNLPWGPLRIKQLLTHWSRALHHCLEGARCLVPAEVLAVACIQTPWRLVWLHFCKGLCSLCCEEACSAQLQRLRVSSQHPWWQTRCWGRKFPRHDRKPLFARIWYIGSEWLALKIFDFSSHTACNVCYSKHIP